MLYCKKIFCEKLKEKKKKKAAQILPFLFFSQYFRFDILAFSRWKLFAIQDEKFLFLEINVSNRAKMKNKSNINKSI